MASKVISVTSSSIYSEPEFKQDFIQLTKNEFVKDKTALSEEQIKKLLESAAIFSLSDKEEHQQLALKISIFLLNQYKSQYKPLPFVVELILTRLGDLPTINHMIGTEDGKDYFSYFNGGLDQSVSYLQFPEIARRKTFNQIMVNEQKWNFTNFQSNIFFELDKGKNVSFSAPTSAGKSFVVHNYIIYRLLHSYEYCVVYIVPTKSLLTEVQESLYHKLSQFGVNFKEVMVFNSASQSNIEKIKQIKKKVLVLTQERLQQILSRDIDLKVDLLVVDEAQKVNDENRGIIIEDAVQELLAKNNGIQKVFISPNVGNPEKFKEIFDVEEDVVSLKTTKTPVGQNIFLVNFSNREVNILLKSSELKETIDIQKIPITRKIRNNAVYPRKVWVANNLLRGNGHTLVYCNTRIECRNVADGISAESPDSSRLQDLEKSIEFLKSHVHEYYYLIDHLKKGVGYHYGKMPQFVRFTVKELFDQKLIEFLCCTSTLLEGVNLPAKNIILNKPKSGLKQKMDNASILNLAGRAGRLAKDYYGNIYCIDTEDWESGQDAFDGEVENVESALEITISKNMERLLAHLDNYAERRDDTRNIETIATSLIIKQLKDPESRFLQSLKKRCPNITDNVLSELRIRLQKIVANISSLDSKVILKNRAIDPRLQHELYEYLKAGNLVIPQYPSESDDFYKSLLKIFEIISKLLLREKKESYRYYVYVANEWINQKTYKAILENKIAFTARTKNVAVDRPFVNKMIDDLDDILEQGLKFEYSRCLQCYCDLVEKILEERNDDTLFCKDLADYLEAGASDPRIFLLLGMGLSRNSAISLYRYLDQNITDISACIEWIKKNNDLVKSKLHDIQYRELESLIENAR